LYFSPLGYPTKKRTLRAPSTIGGWCPEEAKEPPPPPPDGGGPIKGLLFFHKIISNIYLYNCPKDIPPPLTKRGGGYYD